MPTSTSTPKHKKKAQLLRVGDLAFDTALAILPSKLDQILRAVGPRIVLDQSALQEFLDSGVLGRMPVRAMDDDDDEDDDEMDEMVGSAPPYQLTADGVAVIPISGLLMKSGGLMSALSGSSSYTSVTAACAAACADPAVKGLLLDVDSPGGTVHGVFEATDAIYALRGSGKPIYACANDQACSAAYALASAADKLYMSRTAGVGSVGVFSLHRSQAALDDKLGVAYTYIHFGAKKVAGNEHEPLSKSARSDIQAMVDRTGEMFVAAVARNRNIDPALVLGTQAAVLFSDSAIPNFADKVGTIDDCMAALVAHISRLTTSTARTSATIIPKAAVMAGIEGDVTNMEPTAAEKAALDAANALAAAAAAEKLAADQKAEADRAAAALVAKTKADADAVAAAAPAAANHDPAPATGTANSAAVEIAELCGLSGYDGNTAGKKNMLGTFLSERKTVAEARKALHELRAAESAATSVDPNFGAVSTSGLDSLDKAVTAAVAASGGKLSRSAAMEAAIKANPSIYEQIEEDKRMAVLRGPKATREYVAALQKRLPAMGLSATIS